MRVVSIVAPFAQEIFGLSSLRGEMGPEDVCPQQRYATGEQGKVQGPERVGIVEGSCGHRVRGVSFRGKFVLSRNLGYKVSGVVK